MPEAALTIRSLTLSALFFSIFDSFLCAFGHIASNELHANNGCPELKTGPSYHLTHRQMQAKNFSFYGTNLQKGAQRYHPARQHKSERKSNSAS
jgi:hypothetical protein